MLNFKKLTRKSHVPSKGRFLAILKEDNWDDYSFGTMFYLTVFDQDGVLHDIGNVKIGYAGQDKSRTSSRLLDNFEALDGNYFSLGQDLDYYQNVQNKLTPELRDQLLSGLRDVAFNEECLRLAQDESVFSTSLLRSVSLAAVYGQFRRILSGGVPLTDFDFKYSRDEDGKYSGIDMTFSVKSSSTPSTNIHAVIGRNGVGKTTLLNGMIESVMSPRADSGFYDVRGWSPDPIGKDYFSSLVSVSFSAFDPFNPPEERSNPALGTCYYYVGLKRKSDELEDYELKKLDELRAEFVTSVSLCLSQPGKRERWLKAISSLESDENFAEMKLRRLADKGVAGDLKKKARSSIKRMSSGHAVVLLSITKLVELVEEKTLVLIDEPESHLHPPLLSAFVRALSELLFDRNGVCILATHSPVVLQEIPKKCVWKITRSKSSSSISRPELETFGENSGVLTREVFALEVAKSGFHGLLSESVTHGGTYEDILVEYGGQLGYEAKAILRAMIANRDSMVDGDV